jgi:membrane protease YdiL (CAAX protease family)
MVLSPIMEELIFRGRLYNLLGHCVSPFMAAFLSSLLFAAVHLQPIVMIEGFLSGMLFSYMYLLKRSIILPIMLHICNNMIAYGLQILSYAGKPLMEYIGSEHYYLPLYITSSALVLVFVAFMAKRFYKEYKLTMKRVECEI